MRYESFAELRAAAGDPARRPSVAALAEEHTASQLQELVADAPSVGFLRSHPSKHELAAHLLTIIEVLDLIETRMGDADRAREQLRALLADHVRDSAALDTLTSQVLQLASQHAEGVMVASVNLMRVKDPAVVDDLRERYGLL